MKKVLLCFAVLLTMIATSCSRQIEISGLLDIPDAMFEYTAEGSGIPCITFSGSENIGHNIFTDALRQHFLLIHADQSKLDTARIADITIDMIVDDIEKVRMAIGRDEIAVMGHSMFASLPFEYALKYPENSAYSIATGGRPFTTQKYTDAVNEYWESNASDERKEILEKNNKKLSQVDMTQLTQTEQFITSYTAGVPRFFYDPNFDMSQFWEGVQINTDFTNHFNGVLLKDFDNSKKYQYINNPVLVIAGRYDFWAPYYLWKDVKDLMPDFTFHLFENAGHNPMLEVPDEFDRVVVEWIESKK